MWQLGIDLSLQLVGLGLSLVCLFVKGGGGDADGIPLLTEGTDDGWLEAGPVGSGGIGELGKLGGMQDGISRAGCIETSAKCLNSYLQRMI